MKNIWMVSIFVFALCFMPVFQHGDELTDESLVFDQNVDEAAIREIMKKSIDGMNDHDIKAHLSTITEEYETWSGGKTHEDREKSLAEFWQRQKSVHYTIVKVNSINFITPNAAIYNARVNSSGQVNKDGTPMPDDEWQGVWILIKKDAKWLIAAWYTRPVGD